MEKYFSFERATAIRAIPLGLLFAGVMLLLLRFDLLEIDASWEVNLANAALCVILGSVLDFLGLYKLHPLYRLIRKDFFGRLYEVNHPNKTDISLLDRIQTAEHIREEVLYSQDEKRLADLRVEHAIWILLYNVSIVLFVATILMIFLISDKDLELREFQLILSLFVASFVITSWSAVARNRSYGEKLIYLAQKRKENEK